MNAEWFDPLDVPGLIERYPYRADTAALSLREYTVLAMSLGRALDPPQGFAFGERGGVLFLGCEYTVAT